MNFDKIKDLIEFNNIYKTINIYYNKYCIVKYYRDIVLFLDSDASKKNISEIIVAVDNIGYKIPDCSNYSELFTQLNNVLNLINYQVINYEMTKLNDKVAEDKIKKLFSNYY